MRRKKMKYTNDSWKKLISLLLAVALVLPMLGNLTWFSYAASTDSTYVYIPVKDLTNAARYEGSTIVQNFLDTSIGGVNECGNYTLLLQSSNDWVEYDIDLDDVVETAVLKVHAKHAQVSVKPAGGSLITLTAKNGAAADRGVNLFDLTEANALASNDNRFTVRISFKDQAVVLNSLAVIAEQPELTDTYTLEPLGESYLQNVADVSPGATRYFLNGTIPTVYLHTGEYVTFYFDFADNAQSIGYSYANAGGALTGEISANGGTWTQLPSAGGNLENIISLPTDKTFYLRFTAEAAESFLHSLVLTPMLTIPASSQLYLPLNSLSDASEYGGTGLFENFNDTYADGSDVENKTLLLQSAGDYVAYNLDMDDHVTHAQLKLYITGGKVEVKPLGGTYTTLTAKNGSGFNRNVAIYDLNETNALSGSTNTFTLRISFDGSTVVLNSLLLQAGIPELDSVYTLELLGKNYLQNVADVSPGATRYFLNHTIPTIHLHTNEQVTFKFNFTDDADHIILTYAQAGQPLNAQISTNGSIWTSVASDAIIRNTEFYVRFTADSGDGFLRGLTLTPVIIPSVDAGTELYLPLNSLSAASEYGGTGLFENFNDTYTDGSDIDNKTLLLQSEGDYVAYYLDMDDRISRAQLKLYITGGKVEVKPEGGSYTTLTAKNGSNFNRNVAIYELDETNALSGRNNKFNLRISFDGSTVVLNSLLLQASIPETQDSYNMEVLGKSYLQNVVDVSAGVTRYFLNHTIPTVYLHTGEYVTFRFRLADEAVGALLDYTQAGAPLTAEISTNGSQWTPVESGILVDHTAFYLRFTANAADAFLSGLTVEPHSHTWEEASCISPKFCSACGSFVGEALGHSFTDWVIVEPATVIQDGQRERSCSTCNETFVEILPKIEGPIEQWNLSLGDDIGINFYAKLDAEEAANAVMDITVAGKTVQAEAVSDDSGYYAFSANAAAAQMTEKIRAELKINGETVDGGIYSVRDYADVILKGNYYDPVKKIVKSMLNYGAKAQLYFGCNTDNLANAGYEEDAGAVIPSEYPDMAMNGKAKGVTYRGATLVFESKTAIRYYFRITGSIDSYTFTAGEKTCQPIAKDGLYYVEISGINPQDLDQDITMVITDSDGGKLAVAYNPMCYIMRMYNKQTSSDTLKELLLAMYNYHETAKTLLPSLQGMKHYRTAAVPKPAKETSKTLQWINLDGRSNGELMMMTTLQGNVNRVQPSMYIIHDEIVEGTSLNASAFWFAQLSELYTGKDAFQKVQFTDPYAMLVQNKDYIKGAVIYHERLTDADMASRDDYQSRYGDMAVLNLTLMMCGQFEAVALTQTQYNTLKNQYGLELPILGDTTQFMETEADGSFSAERDSREVWDNVYGYALENFGATSHPKALAHNAGFQAASFDYYVANKIFVYNRIFNKDATEAERQMELDILKVSADNTPVFGCWYLQADEGNMVPILTANGKYMVVSYESFNLSWTSGLPYEELKVEEEKLTLDPNKNYIAFTFTEGDNNSYLQFRLPQMFESADKGQYPIGWTLAATCWETNPNIIRYCRMNWSEGDGLAIPEAGVGYVYNTPPVATQDEFFAITDEYLELCGTGAIRLLQPNPVTALPYAEKLENVDSLLCGYLTTGNHNYTDDSSHFLFRDTPIFVNYSGLEALDLAQVKNDTPGFYMVSAYGWQQDPSSIKQIMETLGESFVAVTPTQLADLYRQYYGGEFRDVTQASFNGAMTRSEMGFLYQATNYGDYDAKSGSRYANKENSFIYKFDLADGVQTVVFDFSFKGYCKIEASTDCQNWTTMYQNLALTKKSARFNASSIAVGGKPLYIRFSDPTPRTGNGVYLYGLSLTTDKAASGTAEQDNPNSRLPSAATAQQANTPSVFHGGRNVPNNLKPSDTVKAKRRS